MSQELHMESNPEAAWKRAVPDSKSMEPLLALVRYLEKKFGGRSGIYEEAGIYPHDLRNFLASHKPRWRPGLRILAFAASQSILQFPSRESGSRGQAGFQAQYLRKAAGHQRRHEKSRSLGALFEGTLLMEQKNPSDIAAAIS